MIFKKTFGNIRITFTLAKVAKVIGVNSNLSNGKHILMWDFDDTTLEKVRSDLTWVQIVYDLPEIIIVRTSPFANFVAYCFKQYDWLKALSIVASTQGIDSNFIKYSAYREHFTLRVTPKKLFVPEYCETMPSRFTPDCYLEDLRSWVRYETLPEHKR